MRPKLWDEAIVREAVRAIVPEVAALLDDDTDRVERDLVDAVQDAIDFDGYKIARVLEDQFYWSPDSALVELLDGIGTASRRELDLATERWVLDNNILPSLRVGDVVRAGKDVGTITAVYPERGQYVVNMPHKGHVKSGVGSHGEFWNFEEVTLEQV